MGFNATFNNISVISWRSVLLIEETAVPGENHQLPWIGTDTSIKSGGAKLVYWTEIGY
jgi:hypothetical protein